MRTPLAYPAALLALLVSVAASAGGALRASDAWVRATPGSGVAAAYLTLTNSGTQPVSVTGVRCPLARDAMVHETRVIGTTSTMRPRTSVEVAPGARVQFSPGGLHVMLVGLAHVLRPGEEVPLEFTLSDGSTLTVSARVRPLDQE